MIDLNTIDELKCLVRELGKEVESLKQKIITADKKKDGSPVTIADEYINKYLLQFLSSTKYKNIISEEHKLQTFSLRKGWDYYWVIDPIDGTKEYLNKSTDYTINVALCRNDSPIFGLVYAPALEDLYISIKNEGSYKNDNKIESKKQFDSKINVVASLSHLNPQTKHFIKLLKAKYEINLVQAGSSLKICLVAEGKADIYPRFGPTMEWDTCAAHSILTEAGGFLLDQESNDLRYNKEDPHNPFFYAVGSKQFILK
ncbi:MAG: 3'(2'),5'-bisphosphate nucleotidase CysQ [Gammaproteobacteria bacterium]